MSKLSTTSKRIGVSLAVTVLGYIATLSYRLIQGPVESGIAAKQVEDSVVSYALAKGVPGLIPRLVFWAVVVTLLIVWLPPLWRWLRATPKKEE